MVSKYEIDKAKRFDMRELIESLGIPHRRDHNHIKICCPFHEESTPSFAIYDDGHFYCYGCQESGDVIDLVRHLYKVSFAEAVKMLAYGRPRQDN